MRPNPLLKFFSHVFKSRVYKGLWALALPIMVNNILSTLMGFADLFMVGQLGEDVISAIGNASQATAFLFLLFAAISQGGAILIAQYYGAGDKDAIKRCVGTFIFSGFLIAAILCPLTFFFGESFIWLLTLGRGAAVSDIGGEYLRIVSFGYISFIPGTMVASALRAMGDTKTPVKVGLAMNVLNILGNFILIFGIGPIPRMGYAGAALSTAIAQGLQGIILLAFILFRKVNESTAESRASDGSVVDSGDSKRHKLQIRIRLRDILNPNFSQLGKIAKIGYPMTIDGIYWQGARIAYTLIFNFLGSHAYAAYSIVKSIKGMATIPTAGLQAATMISVGQELGRKRMGIARVKANEGIKLSVSIMAIPSILVFFFSWLIVSLFKIEPETFSIAVACTMILAVSIFFTTVNSIIPGILRSGGDTVSVMTISLLCFVFVGGPLAYLLGIVFKFGAVGAFVGISLEEVVKAFVFALRMKKGLWLKSLV